MRTYAQIVDLLGDTEHALVPGPGKFEGTTDERIAEGLYSLSLDGQCDEERGGNDDPDTFGTWYGRIGRFIIWEDDRGFFGYDHFDSEEEAAKAFATHGR